MTNVEFLFDMVVALGRKDAEVRLEVLAAEIRRSKPDGGDAEDAGALFEGIAELMRDGRVETWEKSDGKIAVYLTALSAERLNLKLLPDSSRWVDKKKRLPLAKRSKAVKLTAETDLDWRDYPKLDEMADLDASQPIDNDLMWERMAEARARVAKVSGPGFMKQWDALTPPEVVLTGSLPYPVPNHDKGRDAPAPVPTAEDVERDWKLRWAEEWSAAHGGAPAPCYTCKGLPMPVGTLCEPCGRKGDQERVSRVLDEARAEVEAAWAAWERRKVELREENERAVAEIMACSA